MTDYENYNGYQESGFLSSKVSFPKLTEQQSDDLASVDDNDKFIARYVNYSLVLSKSRKFPFFTASNIDGKKFLKAPRKDNWRKDKRIDEADQWGKELYGAPKSDFDRGHMTKREDVQWGDNIAEARFGADSTFFYTNSVPQHAKLNQRIWLSLEDYVLHTEAEVREKKICVFTGPVLSPKDPFFVTKIDGEKVKIPVHFWKVILFEKSDKKLYAVGFMMSHSSLLKENGIVEEDLRESKLTDEEENMFLEFEGADTYQVNLSTIETLTGLKFPKATEPFTDKRKIKLILEEIDVKESLKESANPYEQMGFKIVNLTL